MSTLNNYSVMAFFCFYRSESATALCPRSIQKCPFFKLWMFLKYYNDIKIAIDDIVSNFSKCQDTPPYHHLDSKLIEFIDEKRNVHYIDLTATVEGIPDIDMPLTRRFNPANVQFWLYSRANLDDYKELLIPEENEVPQETHYDVFNPDRALVVVTHGWMSSGSSKSTQKIKNAFLAEYDVNVIVVHWEKEAAKLDYTKSACYTILVAEKVRQMIISLAVQHQIVSQDVHLIGHSLGAHIMGLTGRILSKQNNFVVGRVSGLDPARPFFEFPKVLPAINSNSAAFVEIIHTNIGILGYIDSIGHADFYPNGGLWQPHCCKNDKSWSCAHACAYVYYAESVSGRQYNASKCNSYKDFLRGLCKDNEMQLMGLPTMPTADGSYYINIESKVADWVQTVLG